MRLVGTLTAYCADAAEYAAKLAEIQGNSAFSNIVENVEDLKVTFDVDTTE